MMNEKEWLNEVQVQVQNKFNRKKTVLLFQLLRFGVKINTNNIFSLELLWFYDIASSTLQSVQHQLWETLLHELTRCTEIRVRCNQWIRLILYHNIREQCLITRFLETFSELSFTLHWVHQLLEGCALIDAGVLQNRLEWNFDGNFLEY